MVVEFSKSFVHNTGCEMKAKYSETELQQVLLQLMKEHNLEVGQENIKENGLVEVNGLPNIKMHAVLLEAEKMGLPLKLTRKTLIELG